MKKKKGLMLSLFLVIAVGISGCGKEVQKKVGTSISEEANLAYSAVGNEDYHGDFKVGEEYSGFKLAEKSGRELLFEHVKSGAKVYYNDNDSELRSFTIGFRTFPDNNKGTAHVLEHMLIVGGGQKYPAKQMFNEIEGRIAGGYFNAFTLPEYTEYKFRTMNENDFAASMDVYMDNIFNSNAFKDDRVFKEEAWNYSIDNRADDIKYNGVVYNEMMDKTSMYILKRNLQAEALFPSTSFKYNSVGRVQDIPKLTFEEAKSFYDRYYRADNSVIVMIGKMDISERLSELNEGFFKEMTRGDEVIAVQEQDPQKEIVKCSGEYSVNKGTNLKYGTQFSVAYALPQSILEEEEMILKAVINGIMRNEDSEFKRRIRDKKLNIYAEFLESLNKKYISFGITTEAGKTDENMKRIFKELDKALKSDSDKENIKEYIIDTYLDESVDNNDSNKRVEIEREKLEQLLIEQSPFKKDRRDTLEKVEKIIDEGRVFEIVRKYTANNPHGAEVTLRPIQNLNKIKEDDIKKSLKSYKDSLSEEELDILIRESKELDVWINTPSGKDEINKLPKTEIEDIIDLKANSQNRKEFSIDGQKVFYYKSDDNLESKVKMYFSAEKVKKEDLSYLALFGEMITRLGARDISSKEVSYQMREYVEDFKWDIKYQLGEEVKPIFILEFSLKNKDMEKAFKLLEKILKEPEMKKNDEFAESLMAIGKKVKNFNLRQYANAATVYSLGKIDERFNMMDKTKYITFSKFITELNNEYPNNHSGIIDKFKFISENVFTRDNLSLSIAASEKQYEEFETHYKEFLDSMGESKAEEELYKFDSGATKIAISMNTRQVNNSQTFNYNNIGYEYKGNMSVLQEVIGIKYLWKELRIGGSAYTPGIIINDLGTVIIITYADSEISETYNKFNKIPEFIENLELDEDELNAFKMKALEKYCKNYNQLELMKELDSWERKGIDEKIYDERIQSILNTTVQDLRGYAEMFRVGLNQKNIITIGSREKIQKNKALFNKIYEGIDAVKK